MHRLPKKLLGPLALLYTPLNHSPSIPSMIGSLVLAVRSFVDTRGLPSCHSLIVTACATYGNPQQKEYKEKGVFNSGCSRHMTGSNAILLSMKIIMVDLFPVECMSQICDKKNNILFTDTECLVLSSNFKLLDESQVLLRVPRKDNIYSVELKSIVPTKGLTCLFAKAIIDESNLWHRRLGHINFKNINKLVKENLIRGQDTKIPQSGGPPIKVGDEAVHKELGDRMERAATTASSLEVEQDSGSGYMCQVTILRLQMRKLGLRLHLNSPMIHLSQELTYLEVGRTKSKGSEGFHQMIDFLTASHINTLEDGDMGITATIDGKVKVVSEASIRRHLKLEDSDGISTLSTAEIFEQLALMGIYIAPTLTQKLFSNMKRASKGYTGVDTPLFQTMLVQGQTLQGEGSTIPVESHHTPTSAPSTSQPPTSSPSMPTTHVAEEAALMPHDSPLPRVHSLGSDEGSLTLNELTVLCTSLSKKVESLESDLKQTKQTYGAAYTKLIMKVKKLEHKVKSIKARRKVILVISDDEDDLEDPFKQGRKIAQIDEDEGITLVQIGAQTRGRSDEDLMYETGVYDYPEGFTGPSISINIVEPVTTAGEGVSIARTIPEEVSTAEPDMDVTLAEELVDLLKSGKKKSPKPKVRGISFQDPKEVARRELAARVQAEVQELYSIEEKSRLLVEMIAKRKRFFAAQRAAEQRSKPPTKTQMRNRMCTYLKNMGGYKYNQLKGKSYEEIQKLFDKTYKQVNSFVPMASDDKEKGSEKKAGGSRKKTLAKKRAGEKQSEESSKRQKMEDDAEKEELRAHLDIISGDDVAVSVESLATKYLIVDWKTHVLSEDKMYYDIIRANGSTKSYKIFTEMLDNFDRQDVLDLYRLVKERFEAVSPEGYDRLLWGDLIIVFELSKDDEVWKAQQDYTLISWRLFDSCGIHVLLMDTGISIHMLVEKTYPLTQEMLSRMLSWKLEVDNESEIAFELLRFIRSQIEK
ncbi:ribonuclease H-like domain-containing protein [Tanacetum coccineum]